MQLRTSDHDGISAQVTVTIKAVAEPEEPEEPGKPSNPEKPEKLEMPRSGSAVQALAIISLLLVIAPQSAHTQRSICSRRVCTTSSFPALSSVVQTWNATCVDGLWFGRTSRVRILTLTLFRRKALPTMI